MPDLLIFNHGWDGDKMAFGLAVELKAKKGKAREEQLAWLQTFSVVMGWRCAAELPPGACCMRRASGSY